MKIRWRSDIAKIEIKTKFCLKHFIASITLPNFKKLKNK